MVSVICAWGSLSVFLQHGLPQQLFPGAETRLVPWSIMCCICRIDPAGRGD